MRREVKSRDAGWTITAARQYVFMLFSNPLCFFSSFYLRSTALNLNRESENIMCCSLKDCLVFFIAGEKKQFNT